MLGRNELERRTGRPILTFAYPFGRYDARAISVVAAAGYVGAGTTDPRRAQPDADPLRVPRIEIRGTDSSHRFLFKLWFGVS